jgi:tripartite-type tricarboxylate transporter receptor subunit TctC
MQEAGLSGYDINSWQAMFAPAGTPPAIIRRLQVEVADILKQPENAQQLAKLGMELDGRTPEQLSMFLAVEVPRLAEIVRKSGAKARDPASQKSK